MHRRELTSAEKICWLENRISIHCEVALVVRMSRDVSQLAAWKMTYACANKSCWHGNIFKTTGPLRGKFIGTHQHGSAILIYVVPTEICSYEIKSRLPSEQILCYLISSDCAPFYSYVIMFCQCITISQSTISVLYRLVIDISSHVFRAILLNYPDFMLQDIT